MATGTPAYELIYLAGLCSGCREPITFTPLDRNTHRVDYAAAPDEPTATHDIEPRPGSVTTADVWDCDQAASGRLGTYAAGCDCAAGPLLGIFYDPDTGATQSCDRCRIYPGDLEAATALAAWYRLVVRFYADGDDLRKSARTYDQGVGFDGMIADGTDPWVEPRVIVGDHGWQADRIVGVR